MFYFIVAVLGLMFGSFLNVVIYRMPIMLKHAWTQEAKSFLSLPHEPSLPVNLFFPRSNCPRCQQPIRWFDNIPVLSFIWLKGQCRQCTQPIRWRYPIIEVLSMVLCVMIARQWGMSWQSLLACIFVLTLLAQSAIDVEHQLLLDDLSLPILWLGILVNTFFGFFCSPEQSVVGAVLGYLTLATIAFFFQKLTKKEGMGQGDFKFLALIGAWTGAIYLPFVIFFASFLGSFFGLIHLLIQKKSKNTPFAFGPFLGVAGFVTLMWGEPLYAIYFRWIGIHGF